MKKILSVLMCLSLLACSKDEPKTMNLDSEEGIINSIVGKWQYVESWTDNQKHISWDGIENVFKNTKLCIVEFKTNSIYNLIFPSGEIYHSSNFSIDSPNKRLNFKGLSLILCKWQTDRI